MTTVAAKTMPTRNTITLEDAQPNEIAERALSLPKGRYRVVFELEDDDPEITEDMDIFEISRISSERIKKQGLTGKDIAKLMEVDDEEARNLGLYDD